MGFRRLACKSRSVHTELAQYIMNTDIQRVTDTGNCGQLSVAYTVRVFLVYSRKIKFKCKSDLLSAKGVKKLDRHDYVRLN